MKNAIEVMALCMLCALLICGLVAMEDNGVLRVRVAVLEERLIVIGHATRARNGELIYKGSTPEVMKGEPQ